jgi:hypothetical protein
MDERNKLDQALLVLNPVVDQVAPMDQLGDQAAFY